MPYKADLSFYQEQMNGANLRDAQVSLALLKAHDIRMSKDELRRFSYFLIRKDPTYPAWSRVGLKAKGLQIVDIEPYYRARLEFRQSQAPQEIEVTGREPRLVRVPRPAWFSLSGLSCTIAEVPRLESPTSAALLLATNHWPLTTDHFYQLAMSFLHLAGCGFPA